MQKNRSQPLDLVPHRPTLQTNNYVTCHRPVLSSQLLITDLHSPQYLEEDVLTCSTFKHVTVHFHP